MIKCFAGKLKAVKSVLKSKSGASMWEYLLVIAIVCVIGAALLAVINGDGGISTMWQGLVNKFSSLLNIGST